MTKQILVLNAGSSSLKFAVFARNSVTETTRGQVSGIGTKPRLETPRGKFDLPASTGFREGLELLLNWLGQNAVPSTTIAGLGHRIVHGGTQYTAPIAVTDSDVAVLDSLRRLAPLHLPFGLSVLREMRKLMPNIPHVACFDTAFHATQPPLATLLPLPVQYRERGYRRYGFHGLNYEHVVDALPKLTGEPLPRRLLVAHLGSGASICAVLNGRSVATTMGYSTADGLVMGTRTGSIDPGLLPALMRDEGLSLEQLEDLLYRKSGLLGLSGITSDMKVLLESTSPDAKQAVDYYCYSAARHAASLLPTLGGLDAMVFTGGIGENAGEVRQRILTQLEWLPLPARKVYIVPANEELMMARHVAQIIGS